MIFPPYGDELLHRALSIGLTSNLGSLYACSDLRKSLGKMQQIRLSLYICQSGADVHQILSNSTLGKRRRCATGLVFPVSYTV